MSLICFLPIKFPFLSISFREFLPSIPLNFLVYSPTVQFFYFLLLFLLQNLYNSIQLHFQQPLSISTLPLFVFFLKLYLLFFVLLNIILFLSIFIILQLFFLLEFIILLISILQTNLLVLFPFFFYFYRYHPIFVLISSFLHWFNLFNSYIFLFHYSYFIQFIAFLFIIIFLIHSFFLHLKL